MTRFAYLAFAYAALIVHALFLHPIMVAQHSSEADEINLAVWIFGCALILVETYCLTRRPAEQRPVDAEQTVEAPDGEPWLTNERMKAMLDQLTLAPAHDMHMGDAFAYGMYAHRIGISREGLIEMFPVRAADMLADSPVDAVQPAVAGVDLAKYKEIVLAGRQGGKHAAATLEQILAAGAITPDKLAPPAVTLRARRKGKKFTYDRVMAAA